MALVQKKLTPKKRNILAIIVVGFIGISAVLVIQNYWKPGGSTNPSDEGSTESLNVRDVPIYTDLGVDVLQDARWQELKMPNMTLPLELGVVGRTNPFVDAMAKPTQ